jgi:hypothetical protein
VDWLAIVREAERAAAEIALDVTATRGLRSSLIESLHPAVARESF